MPGPRYVKDFEFPSSAGFSGSATDRKTTSVAAHERSKPRFAEGGLVDRVKKAFGMGSDAPPSQQKQVAQAPTPPKKSDTVMVPANPANPADELKNTRARQMKELGLKKGGRAKKKFAEGGSALVSRSRTSSDLDEESGGRGPLRPGYNKGGLSPKMCKAMGGPVAAKKGGMPKGKGGKGAFQRTPLFGK